MPLAVRHPSAIHLVAGAWRGVPCVGCGVCASGVAWGREVGVRGRLGPSIIAPVRTIRAALLPKFTNNATRPP
jgi:hypothetical protein